MTFAAKPAAISVDRLSKTYPVPFLRLKKFLRRKFKPPVEACATEQNLLFFARLQGLSDRAAKRRITELFEVLELQGLGSRRFAEP